MNILGIVLGGYLVVDGVYSIIRYWNAPVTDHFIDALYKLLKLPPERVQGWPDHSIRVIRSAIGAYFVYLSI